MDEPQGRRKPIHADRAYPDDGGKVRFMTQSGGYVMVRRPRSAPFILTEKEWGKWPLFQA